MTTRIYIDTEFTDLLDMDLISIACVCGDDQFYAERSDYDDSLCSAFTKVLRERPRHSCRGWIARKPKASIAVDISLTAV